MSLVLLKPELDKWTPGEHSGTFRGNNLAFIASQAAIAHYWSDKKFSLELKEKSLLIEEKMMGLSEKYDEHICDVRGYGMIWGAEFNDAELASKICGISFKNGLVIETAGSEGQVIKFLAPLIISEALINEGFDILDKAISTALSASF